MKITFEDIIFWIFILIIIGAAIWLLSGSPPEIDALIAIGIAVAGSEIMIWKKIYYMENSFNLKLKDLDKKTTIGFMNVKHDFDKFRLEFNNRIDNIDNKLNEISKRLK